MTYPQVIKYLESFINYELFPAFPYKESLKLQRIRGFLRVINNPQRALRCIHVAGTKGKGSTCAFIAYILREAGYSAGLYTSPHLSDFRERIRILRPKTKDQRPKTKDFEGIILKEELSDLVKRLKPFVQEYNKKSKYGPLTFFEVYTALAFVYFKEKKADFVVLESGLGGRLDATNTVDSLVSVVTPISLEHTQKLGNTVKKIAGEKAGIIKKRGQGPGARGQLIVISAPQEEEARRVIRNKCEETGAKLYEVGTDILVTDYRLPITDYGFKIKGIFDEYTNLKIRLLGRHQMINAATSVAAVEALRHRSVRAGIDSIRKGLYNTRWPGRCEVISREPRVVLDGAQNIASACVLKKTITSNFKYKKLILIFGISSDKDIKGVSRQLYDLADTVILTKADNPRAVPALGLDKYFKGKEVHITENIQEAKREAFALALKDDLILVTGSLFVVGEFRDENKRLN